MARELLETETGAGVALHSTWLRVHFSRAEGDHADFHYRWLRHNCDLDRHPQTGERTVCSSELPERLSPLKAWIDHESNQLHVAWANDPEERVSAYALDWLRAHAYAEGRAAVPPPPSDATGITLHAPSISPDTLVAKLFGVVEAAGVVVVRGYGLDTEALIAAIEVEGLKVRPTHYGRIEDLRTDNTTNQNTDQLGYTNYPVKLHTDQPFLEEPPRYQLLQCIRKADIGGENYLVDALAAARYLKSIDRQAFDLLTSVPVRFHRKQKNFEKLFESPLLDFQAPQGFRVRYSYFTLAPYRLPFDLVENWYRAYEHFARIVNDPAHQYHASLEPGDFVLYDNHRALHARNGFAGPRWMRGIYFDK